MKLTWNGHSCFTLETANGTFVLDPYQEGSVPGYAPLQLAAGDLHDAAAVHRRRGAVQP